MAICTEIMEGSTKIWLVGVKKWTHALDEREPGFQKPSLEYTSASTSGATYAGLHHVEFDNPDSRWRP